MFYHILHFSESKSKIINHHMTVLMWTGNEEEIKEFTIRTTSLNLAT